MYLKRVELLGFKSFAEKTALDLLPPCSEKKASEEECGITAVVGPNGSGKSNIADALRWVMGEQSSRNLRGKKAEDVIFAGSKNRSRLGSASVTLLFDNSDHKLPSLEGKEFTITRKIYRSGEGEYFINGARVRLLDIVELFAQMGMGKGGQSVLNQGMSDAILEASPQERREILEEAVGVKPLRLKRQQSFRKLLRTEENLERAEELLQEIEPRLKSLKRQVQRFQQRKEIEEQLHSLQKRYFFSLWKRMEQEKGELHEKKKAYVQEECLLQRQLDSIEEKRHEHMKRLKRSQEEERETNQLRQERERLSHLEREKALLEGRLQAEEERFRHQRLFDVVPVDLPFVRQRLQGLVTLLRTSLHEHKERDASFFKEILQKTLSKIEKLYEECQHQTTKVRRGEDVLQKEREAFLRHQQDLQENIEAKEREIAAQKEKISRYEQKILHYEENRQKEGETFLLSEKKLMELQQRIIEAKQHINQQEVEIARLEAHQEDIVAESLRELGIHPSEIALEAPLVPKEEEQAMREEIERLRAKLAAIGMIDPLLEQEYQETRERHEFLQKETGDLRRALVSLTKVIQELDGRIEHSFRDSLRKLNESFNHFFRHIFGGGQASLRLVQEKREGEKEKDNEALSPASAFSQEYSTGLEIIIRHTHKKIHHLSALSGGERSLVSLALLFAIIAVSPPPFVVLDEVEAALDEHNSRRFGLLLEELAKKTQFLVITHNRETMRHARLLYGVTMNEEGVSKLLSLRLEKYQESIA